jgi:prolipoprotein diacylglyceryltransferase
MFSQLPWMSIRLFSLNGFYVVAWLLAAFLFWRKAREEHYDEAEVFDGFLLSTIVGLVAARVGFIVVHLDRFGPNPLAWLDVVGQPGALLFAGLAGATWYWFRFARAHKFDPYELLDFWVVAVAAALAVVQFGLLVAGVDFGVATSLPVGLSFPGVFDKHHPTQLYLSLAYVALAWYLGRVEYRYRTYQWYRGSRSTAATGFLWTTALCVVGVLQIVVSLLKVPSLQIAGVVLDQMMGVGLLVLGLSWLWIRSGRGFGFGGRARNTTWQA